MPGQVDGRDLTVMVVAQVAIAVMLVGTGCYCVIRGIDIPSWAISAILAVLGAFYGFSAKAYYTAGRAHFRRLNRRSWAEEEARKHEKR